jgi:hypothetical protein
MKAINSKKRDTDTTKSHKVSRDNKRSKANKPDPKSESKSK